MYLHLSKPTNTINTKTANLKKDYTELRIDLNDNNPILLTFPLRKDRILEKLNPRGIHKSCKTIENCRFNENLII